MSFEDQVRERAYHIWLSGGMAAGLEHEHWAMAEQDVKAAAPVVILTKAGKRTASQPKIAAKPVEAKPIKAKAPAKNAKPAVKSTARKVAKAESAAAC